MTGVRSTVQISVLMPSFNQARYIERAVRSVLEQAGAKVELVVMDGGSSDGTQKLLSRLAAEFDGRLHWVSEPDRGPGHALNKALALVQGSVIGWLNSDDVYTPGAVQRAYTYLVAHPDIWMVYGQAAHINADDQVLGPYPTRSPELGLAGFADGCYICQPTVFLRRTALRMLGGFSENLKTAFDFELWLRLFNWHAARIGFIDVVQACSRLHAECITLMQREQVIKESMTLLARHLGAAPLHWAKTYVEELLTEYPHGRPLESLQSHLQEFACSIVPLLTPPDQTILQDWLQHDARINLALPDAYLQVYGDGWLPAQSVLRVRARQSWHSIELLGRHVSPQGGPLALKITMPDGQVVVHDVPSRGAFSVEIVLPVGVSSPERWVLPIHAIGGFVPSQHELGSQDNRELACRIDGLRLHV